MKRHACLLLALLWGCSASNGETGSAVEPAACPSDSAITYANFGKQFVSDYCVRCHSTSLTGGARNGAPSDHNFDTLAAIRDVEVSHINSMAGVVDGEVREFMPPSGPFPTAAERQQLAEWLACGTPE